MAAVVRLFGYGEASEDAVKIELANVPRQNVPRQQEAIAGRLKSHRLGVTQQPRHIAAKR